MSLLLAVAKIYTPEFIQKRKLEILFIATADAFLTKAPSLKGLSYEESLTLYARFTGEKARKSIQQGDQSRSQSRLLRNAYQIGQQLRNDFSVRTDAQVMQMGSIIYKYLKIDFQGESHGNIVIRDCFFSRYYSSSVCQIISSLDEGLLTGLCGGGKLSFSERITEGYNCCRAFLATNRRRS